MSNRFVFPALLALLTPACVKDAAQDSQPVDVDADGDGLLASFEAQISSSDTSADTDGDGCSDAVEVLGYFDPLDATDRPYTGSYPRGPRAAEATLTAAATEHGEAYEAGSLNPNWTMVDQNGEVIELRDFYGQVVVIDLGSEWCVPCQNAAPEWESFYQEHRDEGFVVIQLLLEGVQNDGEPQPGRWIQNTGITFPVIPDHNPGDYTQTELAQHYLDVPGLSFSIPNFTVLNREQIIQELYVVEGNINFNRFDALLAEPAPATDALLPDNADELRAELGFTEGSWVTPASLCDTADAG